MVLTTEGKIMPCSCLASSNQTELVQDGQVWASAPEIGGCQERMLRRRTSPFQGTVGEGPDSPPSCRCSRRRQAPSVAPKLPFFSIRRSHPLSRYSADKNAAGGDIRALL
jgi:hypothetical protein